MTATTRFNFVPGRNPSASYYNRVQDPPRFDGIDRLDPWNPDELRAAWGISQRDGLKDWEIDPRLPLGQMVWGGLVKGAQIDPLTNLRIGSAIGAPNVYLTPNTPTGFVQVEVYGGSIVNTQGEVLSWQDLELTIADDSTTFVWVDATGNLQSGTTLPSQTQIFTPLFAAEVASTSLVAFTDLRPNLHVGYQPTNYFVLLNTSLISDDYTASAWERVVIDATLNSFIIYLPSDPADGDLVGFLDIIGNLSANSIAISPVGKEIERSNAPFILDRDFAHLILVYVEAEGGWFVQSSNFATTATVTSGSVPLGYKSLDTDYSLQSSDHLLWLDFDCTASTRLLTLPNDGMDYGFECYVQALGGSLVLFTAADVDLLSLTLAENEVAHLYWLDNEEEGGSGIWKALQGLTPGSGGTSMVDPATVKASSTDLVPGTLQAKLVAGEGISLVLNNQGANETLTISAEFPPAVTLSEQTLTGTLLLTNESEHFQVLNPDGVLRTVVLPDPPQAEAYFTVVNDSDGLSANGNTLQIVETLLSSPIVTLDDTSKIYHARFLYTGTKWVVLI